MPPLRVGAVAYDPKVVTIWEGFRAWFADHDRDLRSLVVAPAGGAVGSVDDLRGRVVGVGAVDSPQATLLPLSHLRAAGLRPGEDVQVRRFDVLAGKHGDHIGGERDAAR